MIKIINKSNEYVPSIVDPFLEFFASVQKDLKVHIKYKVHKFGMVLEMIVAKEIGPKMASFTIPLVNNIGTKDDDFAGFDIREGNDNWQNDIRDMIDDGFRELEVRAKMDEMKL